MPQRRLTLSQPHYDPERGLYEAYARIIEHGRAFIFRVHVHSPPHADFAFVTRALKQRARAMHPREAGPRHPRGNVMVRPKQIPNTPLSRPVEALPRQIGSLLAA